MNKWLREPERKLCIAGDYDVIVVGGGIAGVAAALAAARAGANVALLEKECALGGLATLGNVVVYLPLCDGKGNQVIKGLGEELLKLSINDKYQEIPECWQEDGDPGQRAQQRYRVAFNASSFVLSLEQLVIDSSVHLWYDTRFCDVIKENDQIVAVVVENKSGRSAMTCRTVVDASGDADVCARAGEPTVSLNTNTASAWFFRWDGREIHRDVVYRPYDAHGGKAEQGGPWYAGDIAEDVTAQVLDSRLLIRERLAKLKENAPPGSIYPVSLPTMPTFRMSRRLRGILELNESDQSNPFPDSIGMTGYWRKAGPVYCIPLRALVGVKTVNLITAGRCMSADTAWDVTRVIPTCAVTGQAAGVAAAMASRLETPNFTNVDVATLQRGLEDQNVLVCKLPIP